MSPLSEGATISLVDEKRIDAALEALAKDPHAPRSISVEVGLHVHNEYPKHVTIGKDKDDQPITKVVNSAEEEAALMPAEVAEPVAADETAEAAEPVAADETAEAAE
jgi:hypothetical protein